MLSSIISCLSSCTCSFDVILLYRLTRSKCLSWSERSGEIKMMACGFPFSRVNMWWSWKFLYGHFSSSSGYFWKSGLHCSSLFISLYGMSLVIALKSTAECCGVRLLIMMLSSLKSSIDLRSILEVIITLISCTPWSISDKSILKSFRSLRMRSSALSITSSILSRIASLLMIKFNVVMLNYFC